MLELLQWFAFRQGSPLAGHLGLVPRRPVPSVPFVSLDLPQKKTAPVFTGAKLPWFSRVARAWLAAYGGVAVWRRSRASGRSLAAIFITAALCQLRRERFGVDAPARAAKLFSINRRCTLLTESVPVFALDRRFRSKPPQLHCRGLRKCMR